MHPVTVDALSGPGVARHIEHLPARVGRREPWPAWVPEILQQALQATGVSEPWAHQVAAAESARQGRHTVVSTGTASGKSLAMGLAVLSDLIVDPSATAIYLSPTKALAHDQLRATERLGLTDLRAATYDGDTPVEERRWVRAHARYILTNPDLIHRSLLPRHPSWTRLLRGLRYIVVDEAHLYRGVFGSHVGNVIRRLRRVAARYGRDPVVLLASATMAEPAASAERLVGAPVTAIVEDTAPRAALTAVLWQPPERADGPRSAIAEAADLLADLVSAGVRTLTFVRSRRGAETIATLARADLAEVDDALPDRVAAYRGGYLPEERRALEADLRSGRLLGLATTNALELGIDISGLDAVLVAGWPGTRASLWQQWGRAGRGHGSALGVFVARADPLDHYLMDHPEAIFERPVEAVVLDPGNPRILAAHLAAAAAEFPLTDDDASAWFGASAPGLLTDLGAQGLLRRRPGGWFWTRRESAADLADLRGTGGGPVQVVESETGRLLGTVDSGAAHSTVHAGAVYVHQGATYVVDHLDLDTDVALVARCDVDYSTTATEVADYRILSIDERVAWGDSQVCLGDVEVTTQVVGYLRRRVGTGQIVGQAPLELPPRTLITRGVWWTVSDAQVVAAGVDDLAGAAHAAEHAAIGLMPLIATCDRWDIGGVSTPLHPDTGRCTVVVYDGHPGGAGFAERGFAAAREWWTATRAAIAACPCPSGCPSCVQSPKCGNGNEPLDKAGAVALLDVLLGS